MEFLIKTMIDRLKNKKKINLNPSEDNITMNASSITGKDSTQKKYKIKCCLIS